MLDELQQRGLIEREPDPADRRVRLLGLTTAGHRLHQDVQSDIRAAEEQLMDACEPADRETFVRVLEMLTRR